MFCYVAPKHQTEFPILGKLAILHLTIFGAKDFQRSEEKCTMCQIFHN